MITPILERLLLTGRAKKFNKVHGVSAAGIIRCPKDRWIVVTDIWYNPFFDAVNGVDVGAIFMQLNCRSKSNEQNYVFKNNAFFDDFTPITCDANVIHMDVFDIHESDVILSIVKSTDKSTATDSSFAPLPTEAQQSLPPNGYGISDSVLRRLIFLEGTEICAAGLDSPGVPTTTRAREDFGIDEKAGDTDLANPNSNNNMPLINFTYISVNSKDLAGL